MTIRHHENLEQGSEEWFAARCGLLTASEVKLIMTEKQLKPASNDKQRQHLHELTAQRITEYVEPSYIGDDMLRGWEDEIEACEVYSDNYEQIRHVGFITNDQWGFTLGYSPDGLVGEDGIVEVKSRRQKYQVQTIVNDEMPSEYMLQVQTGLLVSGRKWCDFISYSAGLPMFTKRVLADGVIQQAIIDCATVFENAINEQIETYNNMLADDKHRLIPTERNIEEEISVS